jgi:hypothetical protein
MADHIQILCGAIDPATRLSQPRDSAGTWPCMTIVAASTGPTRRSISGSYGLLTDEERAWSSGSARYPLNPLDATRSE